MTECTDTASPFSSAAEGVPQILTSVEPRLQPTSRPPSRTLHTPTDSVSSITDMGSETPYSEVKTPVADAAGQQEAAFAEANTTELETPLKVPEPSSAAVAPAAAPEAAPQPDTPVKKASGSLPGPIQLSPNRPNQANGHAKPGEQRLQRQGSSRPSRNNSHSSLAGVGSPGGHRGHQPAWQQHQNGHLPHYSNHMGAGANGGIPPLMMPGAGPPGGTYFPGAPYGQMYPHFPMQMGGPMGEAHLNGGMGPMLFGPGGAPIILPQGGWAPYPAGLPMMLPPEPYNGTPGAGTGAFHPNMQAGGGPPASPTQQMPPIPPPQFFQHYHSARLPPHLAGGANPNMLGGWHAPAGPEQAFPTSGSSGKLNAAAPQFRPEERANGAHPPRPARTVAGAQNGSSPAAGPHAGHRRRQSVESIPEQPAAGGHRRQPSASSSHGERTRGHRRTATWQPENFDADAAVADGDADLDGALAPKKRGHRRQVSMPSASDMERLREGGRRGHSRRGSWHDRACQVLEDYKAAKQRIDKPDWTLKMVKGYVVDFCKDQTGSRFIQDALSNARPEEIDEVLQEARPRIGQLMEDVFGNYVVQKLLEKGSAENRLWLAERICNGTQKGNRAVMLSKQQYGCRVVQKALDMLDVDQQCRIMEQLKGSVLELVADQNGNHVIQKCIEKIKPSERIEPLIQELLEGPANNTVLVPGVVALSMHTYGCRVVQRVLEHCEVAELKQRFMSEILRDVTPLADNEFSNYVIQHVLEKGLPEERERLIRDLCGSLLRLSENKYASNVVEKCLVHGAEAERRAVIGELLSDPSRAVDLMRNEYGNYVYYRAFQLADAEHRAVMKALVNERFQEIRKTNNGKNFTSKLAENFPDAFPLAQTPKSPMATRSSGHFQGRARPLGGRTLNNQRLSPTQHPASPARLTNVPISTRVAVAAALKPEAAGKPSGSQVAHPQVSVTADGAAPPVNTPLPVSALAEEAAAPAEAATIMAKAEEDTREALSSPTAESAFEGDDAPAPEGESKIAAAIALAQPVSEGLSAHAEGDARGATEAAKEAVGGQEKEA